MEELFESALGKWGTLELRDEERFITWQENFILIQYYYLYIVVLMFSRGKDDIKPLSPCLKVECGYHCLYRLCLFQSCPISLKCVSSHLSLDQFFGWNPTVLETAACFFTEYAPYHALQARERHCIAQLEGVHIIQPSSQFRPKICQQMYQTISVHRKSRSLSQRSNGSWYIGKTNWPLPP